MRYNDVEKDIVYCGRYGFEAIELKFNLVRKYDLAWVSDLLMANEVYVGSIGALQLPILQNKEIEYQMERKLHELCQCAHILGAKYIVAIPPRGMTGVEWEKVEEDSVKILIRYSGIAEEYQIKIAIEPTGFADSFLNTVGKCMSVIKYADNDNLGLVYDFYHALGMQDLGQDIKNMLGKDVFIVHINDGLECETGKYKDDDRLWPGDGDVDMVKQISMLMAIGYDGPFSLEVYQKKKWSYDIEKCYIKAWNKMKKMRQFVSM